MSRFIIIAASWLFYLNNFGSEHVVGQEIDLELRDQFLTAMHDAKTLAKALNIHVKAVSKLKQSAATISADLSADALAKLRATGVDPALVTITSEYLIHGDSMLEAGVDARGNDFVIACNSAYAFSIQRLKGSQGYSIRWLEQVGVNPEVETLIVLSLCFFRSVFPPLD